MDLLSQRYANPYAILDDMIRNGQLHEFSNEIMKIISEEKDGNARWEFYLHKVWGEVSFDEFTKSCGTQSEETEQTMPKEEAVKIIKSSGDILNDFKL